MTATAHTPAPLRSPWRLLGWGTAAALLALPAILGWPWPPFAFVAFAIMLAIAGGLIELAARKARTPAHSAGAAIAVLAGFAMQWIGRVGASEGYLENFAYVVVALVAFAGAVGARFRAPGLAWAMAFAAALQLAVAIGGFAAGWVFNDARGPLAQLAFNAALALPWLLAGALFRAKVPDAG
jgi:hypothetical protein